MADRYCATVTMQFNTLASAFTALSERPWVPQRGWVYQGGACTVIVGQGGFQGVFAESAAADLAQLIRALFQDSHEPKPTG